MATGIHAVLTAALLASVVASQDASKKPQFAYPQYGSNKLFNMMDTVMVTYTAFYDTAMLYTFCQPGIGVLSECDLPCRRTDSGAHTDKKRQVYEQKAPGSTATVPVLLNFTSGTPCWFNVRTGADMVDTDNSATFSIVGEERSSGRQVFGLDTDPSPATTASSSSSLLPSTTGASGNSSNPAASSGSSGLSAGASAGIGVGAAFVVLSLAAGLAFLFFWRRRRRRQHARAAEVKLDGDSGGCYGGDGYGVVGVRQQKRPAFVGELNSLHMPAEIGTSAVVPAAGAGRAHQEMSA